MCTSTCLVYISENVTFCCGVYSPYSTSQEVNEAFWLCFKYRAEWFVCKKKPFSVKDASVFLIDLKHG